ncbi:MAG: hypothetical protein QXP66_00890 [Candidatus Aenigmatarchaeota archaeon]
MEREKLKEIDTEPIVLRTPFIKQLEAGNFSIELVKRSNCIIFHLNSSSPILDMEIQYKIVPKKIIHALRNIIPKSIQIHITFVPEMNSWAIYSTELATDPFKDWICEKVIEALRQEFGPDANKVPVL